MSNARIKVPKKCSGVLKSQEAIFYLEKLFQQKYRIPLARLNGFDYSRDGYYFTTICTQNRANFFGETSEKRMRLSEIGKIAEKFWREISAHFSFARLYKFAVMPNHLYGIVIIDKWGFENERGGNDRDCREPDGKDADGKGAKFCVSTVMVTDANVPNKFGPQSKNLASIIRGFKVGVKKYATMHDINFAWQPRFHDRIIRDEKEFNHVQNYILTNVVNWEKNKDNLEINFCE
jgi:hypothetical protein